MARLIRADGTEQEVHPGNGRRFTLPEMQAYVGGYIERVRLRPKNGRRTLLVNEEGLIEGLPYNPKASAMALPGTMLVGDALLCEPGEF